MSSYEHTNDPVPPTCDWCEARPGTYVFPCLGSDGFANGHLFLCQACNESAWQEQSARLAEIYKGADFGD